MCPIEFAPNPEEFVDIDAMSLMELRTFQDEVYALLSDLNTREPKSMNSPSYDDWAEEHEELEDLLDDIQDRIDALTDASQR